MTDRKESRKHAANWLHYHWLWLVVGAVALFLLGHLIWSAVSAPKYDLQAAIIAKDVYPDPVLEQLSEALSAYARDLNGDGKATVRVVQYVIDFRTENAGTIDARTQSAGVSGLLADLRACFTQVFLVEDPDGFSLSTGALRYRDGSLPADGVYPAWQETCCRWQDCPNLTALTFDGYDAGIYGGSGRTEDWFANLYIGSRGFWDGTAPAYPEANEAFWQTLISGAPS